MDYRVMTKQRLIAECKRLSDGNTRLYEEAQQAKKDFERLSVWCGEIIHAVYDLGISDQQLTEKMRIVRENFTEQPLVVGDTVYQTDGVKVYERKIKNIIYETDGGIAFDKTAIGRSIFLKKEDAERERTE